MDQIKINSVNINPLALISDIVQMQFDNSSTLIDEMDGEEFFYLLLDTKANCAVVFSSNEGASMSKRFLDAENAGIYETYIEWKSFEGCFNINAYGADVIEKRIGFQGSEITDSENVSESDISIVSTVLNPKNVFALVNEILNSIK